MSKKNEREIKLLTPTRVHRDAVEKLRQDLYANVPARKGANAILKALQQMCQQPECEQSYFAVLCLIEAQSNAMKAIIADLLAGEENFYGLAHKDRLQGIVDAWTERVRDLARMADVEGAKFLEIFEDLHQKYEFGIMQMRLYETLDAYLKAIDAAEAWPKQDWVKELSENEEAKTIMSAYRDQLEDFKKRFPSGSTVVDATWRELPKLTERLQRQIDAVKKTTADTEAQTRKIYMRFAQAIRDVWDTVEATVPPLDPSEKPLRRYEPRGRKEVHGYFSEEAREAQEGRRGAVLMQSFEVVPAEKTAYVTLAEIEELCLKGKPLVALRMKDLVEAGLVAEDAEHAVILDTGYEARSFGLAVEQNKIFFADEKIYLASGIKLKQMKG